MTVEITEFFKKSLLRNKIPLDIFVELFAEFKAGPPLHSKYFGKDVGYEAPVVGGKPFVLKHVHMIPQSDEVALKDWLNAYKHRAQKTSDRALVYVTNEDGDHLILGLLEEPHAHAIAKMRLPEHQQLMQGFAAAAQQFLIDGTIIV